MLQFVAAGSVNTRLADRATLVEIGVQSWRLVVAKMTQVHPTGTDNWNLNPSGVIPAEPKLGGVGGMTVNVATALVAESAAFVTTTV